MTTEQKPSDAAMRAAEKILDLASRYALASDRVNINLFAAIIDREWQQEHLWPSLGGVADARTDDD